MKDQERIVSVNALKAKLVCENHEPLVQLCAVAPEIDARNLVNEMIEYVGDKIFVRRGLALRLRRVAKKLRQVNSDYRLKVVFGYRHPDIQHSYFMSQRGLLRAQHPLETDEALDERTHQFIAVPDVAGHPAGAAVDLTITEGGAELDFGTKPLDFSRPELLPSFSSFVSPAQKAKRMLLRELMMKEDFAPFDGEWWHFSFGDREWAAYYDRPHALYGQIYFLR